MSQKHHIEIKRNQYESIHLSIPVDVTVEEAVLLFSSFIKNNHVSKENIAEVKSVKSAISRSLIKKDSSREHENKKIVSLLKTGLSINEICMQLFPEDSYKERNAHRTRISYYASKIKTRSVEKTVCGFSDDIIKRIGELLKANISPYQIAVKLLPPDSNKRDKMRYYMKARSMKKKLKGE